MRHQARRVGYHISRAKAPLDMVSMLVHIRTLGTVLGGSMKPFQVAEDILCRSLPSRLRHPKLRVSFASTNVG